jgi:hypothetical protein
MHPSSQTCTFESLELTKVGSFGPSVFPHQGSVFWGSVPNLEAGSGATDLGLQDLEVWKGVERRRRRRRRVGVCFLDFTVGV